MKKRLIWGAFAALAVLCLCVLSGCSGRRTIDLESYVSVEFSGYNGDGAAVVSIDRSAMLPLLDKQVSPTAITESFEAAEIQNNGKLKNGDVIGVTIKYNELLMENSKVKVQNPTLSFTVSGLKEKQKLDVFAAVEFNVEGVSPECTVSVKYNGGSSDGRLEMVLENGEVLKNGFGKRFFKNGEKLTLRLSEDALEQLGREYKIEETEREYTVQVDSAYILTAADLNADARKQLDKFAEDFAKEKVEEILANTEKSARLDLFAAVSGVNRGTLYAGRGDKIDRLEITGLNSAYVGVGNVSTSMGATVKNQKSVYYIYDAEIAYRYSSWGEKSREGDTDCALIVRIDDPKITPEGVMYSKLTFASAKDIDAAYNSSITTSFEKLP
ncbi:MAG: hypothetical protein K2J77_02710 [Oscillospiraceae bacterium]|nr:hypothetical protein [Oscillospiraceae bacterium]